jgi:hypothetical protein
MTLAWWKDVWRSPMAKEFVRADIHGLYVLAELVDAFWQHPTKEMAGEIRLQRQCFGLTPIDRRRLQWEVERVQAAARDKSKRKAPTKPPVEDPRKMLRVVS